MQPTTDTTTTSAVDTLLSAITSRHSYADLSPTSPLPDAEVQRIAAAIMHDAPTAFNTQHVRLILLFGQAHQQLWDIAADVVRTVLAGNPALDVVLGKVAKYRAAQGTATFWDAPEPMALLSQKNPIVAPQLPMWTEHAQGMHHFALWTVLEAAGLGANLQHYDMAQKPWQEAFGVPENWSTKAQLVFGGIEGPKRQRAWEKVEGWRMIVRDGQEAERESVKDEVERSRTVA